MEFSDISSASAVRAVFARELSAAFDSSIAYVACIAAWIAVSSLYMNEFFLTGRLDMTPFFDVLPLVLVLFVPALSMRAWSEDLRTRTFELWMTLPLSAGSVVLGKFLSVLAVYALFLLGTLPIVAMLVALGEPDLGRIAAGYTGAFCLGAQFLAVGLLFSSVTSDQIVAFLSTAFAAFALVFTGHPRVVAVLDGLAPGIAPGSFLADTLSATPHYDNFVRGTVGLTAVVYFAGFAAAFLFLNTLAVEKNRT